MTAPAPVSVLMIEDSNTDEVFVRAMLARAGDVEYRIERAATLADGLAILAERRPDVVLLDLTLPDSEGEDTFISVLADHPDLPLIVVTATGSEALGIAAVNRGAQDYLVKWTVDAPGLARAVRYAIERQRAYERMKQRALRDQLTGLPNRELLNDRLQHAVETAARSAGPLAVMFIDLDGFKGINDTRGHAVGDAVLIEVGRRLQATVRHGDTVARLGGDEFVVVAEGVDAEGHDVAALAARLVDVVGQPIDVDGAPVRVGASIGIAMADTGAETDPTSLLEQADAAMYQAKHGGGSTAVTASPGALRRTDDR